MKMLIQKAYKYRLEPTDQQTQRLRQLCGCARFVWNYALAETLSILDAGGKIPSYFDLTKMLTGWKKLPDLAFLSEGYTDNLQQKLKDLHAAWKRCFDKSLDAAKPVFKKKSKGNDSVRFVDFNKYCELDYRRVRLPSGLGWVKFRQSRKVDGVIRNCSIRQHAGHWYISFQVEQVVADPVHASTSAVGLDVGVVRVIALLNGTVFQPVNSFKTNQDKLARLQRRLARKVKFSANWNKQKARISRLHSHIANTRRDYLHKATTMISNNHAMIVIEDLKVSRMSKSAAGTKDQPGRNVAAKSGLNRAILDQGWSEMRRQLNYKQFWRGGDVVAVNPAFTSQRCARCGHTAKDNRQTQASFVCKTCGYSANADVNGARNILAAGHAVLACGGTALLGRSLKQEPDTERSVATQ